MTLARGKAPVPTARLLAELVNNHLDPGYAAAAQRRGPDSAPRRLDQLAVAAGCLLIGLLLVVAYVHTHRGAPAAAKVHDRLVQRVRAAQSTGDALEAQVNSLERQLSKAQDQVLPRSGALARQLALAQLEAGLVAVKGPGLTVTLREPKQPAATPSAGRGGSTPITTTHILTDRDVRSVVNELWHDGAEAISVNDVRLTPTSAIRFAGEAVIVGDSREPITAPYRIRALGNADQLATSFADSTVATRYQTLSGVEHIGFSFSDSSRLTLPASAPIGVRYATVPAGGRRTPR